MKQLMEIKLSCLLMNNIIAKLSILLINSLYFILNIIIFSRVMNIKCNYHLSVVLYIDYNLYPPSFNKRKI